MSDSKNWSEFISEFSLKSMKIQPFYISFSMKNAENSEGKKQLTFNDSEPDPPLLSIIIQPDEEDFNPFKLTDR